MDESAAPETGAAADPPGPGQQGSMLLLPNLMLPDPIPLSEVHMLISPGAIGSWIAQEEGQSGTVSCIIGAWNAVCGAATGDVLPLTLEDGVKALQDSFYKNAANLSQNEEGSETAPAESKDHALKYVGAWGVISAIEKLRSTIGTRVAASRLLGARQVGGRILGHQTFMTLKETDDETKVDKQWALLKEKVMQPQTVLVFSQGTHFALVFAVREQMKQGGAGTLRSVLTAEKGGQHPSIWLQWDDMRQMMLHDIDSKVLVVEIEPDKPVEPEEEES